MSESAVSLTHIFQIYTNQQTFIVLSYGAKVKKRFTQWMKYWLVEKGEIKCETIQ